MFVALRCGDVINAVVGLWLVPKYVGQEELGAVLPLTQFVSFIGIPLAVLSTPFKKFLNTYTANKEYGKVKALLRDVLCGTGILAALTLLFAYFVLPAIFERMRIQMGMLGILMVTISILSSVSGIFDAAVQGLRLYGANVKFAMLSAPLRLVLMLVFMPVRALSGYFIGQMATPCTSIFGSLWVLRRALGRGVKAVPYLKDDWKLILQYSWPIVISAVLVNVFTSVDQLVIRHRLSDFESAGYYMLTRFTDISNYLGSVFVVFLFPMVSSLKYNDGKGKKILMQSMVGTVVGALPVGIALWFCGKWLLGLNALWCDYQPLAYLMFPLCLLNLLNMLCASLSAYETAHGRFKIMWYSMTVVVLKGAAIYALTGFTFFNGIMPKVWLDALTAFNPCRLEFYVGYSIATTFVLLLGYVVDIYLIGRRSVRT